MLDQVRKNRLLQTVMQASGNELSATPGIFGVELEIEGSRLPSEVRGWVTHQEGSLRGEAREYVTDGAYSRASVATAMDFLEATFAQVRAEPSDSYRAGTHVHYNMQSRTVDEVIKAMIRFTLFEPVFLKLCGARRDGNLFCLSSYDTGDLHLWLDAYYQKVQAGGNALNKLARGKYSSLNTDCLTRFGTLECRTFPTMWTKDRVLDAVDLMDSLLKATDETPRQLLTRAKSEPIQLLREIFGSRQLPWDHQSLLSFGVEQSFLLVEIYHRWMGE